MSDIVAAAMPADRTRSVRLCPVDDLSPNTARGFDPHGSGSDTIFVLRRGDIIRAFVNRCPHQRAALEYRKDHFLTRDGRHVMCHAHGALFDPDTGRCVVGACLGQSLAVVPCWVEERWVWIAATE